MARQRLTPDQVERDEVAEGVHELIVFFQKNLFLIVFVLVALLIGVLTIHAMGNRQHRVEQSINLAIEESLARLYQLEQEYAANLRALGVEDLVGRLDGLLAEYPDHRLAKEALFLKGRALYSAERFEEAQQIYQDYIDSVPEDADKARGDVALAYSYENQSFLVGDQERQRNLLQRALNVYARATERVPNSYAYYYALLGQARINEALHNEEQAIALYERVIEERPLPSVAVVDAVENDTPEEGAIDAGTELIRSLGMELDRMDEQLSFRATAELRLASLRAGTDLGEAAAIITEPADD